MIYARVVTPFGDYEIENPVPVLDGYLGLLFTGYLFEGSTLIQGAVRVDAPSSYWACAGDLDELATLAGQIADLLNTPRAKVVERRRITRVNGTAQ